MLEVLLEKKKKKKHYIKDIEWMHLSVTAEINNRKDVDLDCDTNSLMKIRSIFLFSSYYQ